MKFMSFAFALSASISLSTAAIAAPKVIASIVPVHALVSGVMDGVGTPQLLLSGQNSEHQASFSAEQIKGLGEADLVFIIGGGLELKLNELSGSDAVEGKKFVELSALDALARLPIREGGAWEAHEHGHEHEDGDEHADDEAHEEEHEHDDGKAAFDPHLWLDPENAKVMVSAIAAELSRSDPANAAHYADNAKAVAADLDSLQREISATLTDVVDKPFVVFHDAYQYFERRFGLMAAGSISDQSANAPSAKRLREVRKKLTDTGARCVFREPQFSDKAVQIILEGSDAKEGVLDPIGATLTPGKDAYRQLLLALSRGLRACLAAS